MCILQPYEAAGGARAPCRNPSRRHWTRAHIGDDCRSSLTPRHIQAGPAAQGKYVGMLLIGIILSDVWSEDARVAPQSLAVEVLVPQQLGTCPSTQPIIRLERQATQGCGAARLLANFLAASILEANPLS